MAEVTKYWTAFAPLGAEWRRGVESVNMNNWDAYDALMLASTVTVYTNFGFRTPR